VAALRTGQAAAGGLGSGMKIGVIGCGQMGTAWVAGILRGGMAEPEEVCGYDPVAASAARFAEVTGARVAGDMAGALEGAEIVLLCTKPGSVAGALAEAGRVLGGRPVLVISIAAGISLARMEAASPEGFRLVRAMPNTPAMVGKGASAFSGGSRATAEDRRQAGRLLEAVGLAVELPESLLDAVTGLSGSGPAYGYLLIEAMADGGVRAGLPRQEALRLAAQTVAGAAAMVLETGEHPAVLRDRVTSPGGTTIAGLVELERQGVRHGVIQAVDAAARRARELSGA
jgi:pyrroline-5-carboxylate reductase